MIKSVFLWKWNWQICVKLESCGHFLMDQVRPSINYSFHSIFLLMLADSLDKTIPLLSKDHQGVLNLIWSVISSPLNFPIKACSIIQMNRWKESACDINRSQLRASPDRAKRSLELSNFNYFVRSSLGLSRWVNWRMTIWKKNLHKKINRIPTTL